METDSGQKYSRFCCPTCQIETDRSCCKKCSCSSTNRKVAEELTEECPLKKDQSSECKLSGIKGSKALFICLILLFLAIIGALLLNFYALNAVPVAVPTNTNIIPIPPPKTIVAKPHGAVASDYADCSHIGTSLLRQGGNAVDAAVAATICISVVAPHKTGLGGGGKIMIYSHRDRTNPLVVDFTNNTNEGIFASAKVRVPGFLRGLEFAQTLRGKLPWGKIVEPSVKIAREGFRVTDDLANEIARSVEHGMIWGHVIPGQILQLPILADTLESIARYGCDVFYNGSLSQKVLRDAVVRDKLLHQLAHYEPHVSVSEKIIFRDHAIYLPPRSTVFRSSIEELERLRIPTSNSSTLEVQTLAALTLVRSLAGNIGVLKNLERERYTNIVAMDPHEIYVSIVTGLSAPLGLAHMTGAGFLLDGVDTGNNLDILTPIIFHDEKNICGLRGIFGTDDPILAAQIFYNLILRSFNISSTIENPRFHVFSDGIATENDDRHSMDPNLRAQLNSLVPASKISPAKVSKSVNAITKYAETLMSHSDSRDDGRASRY